MANVSSDSVVMVMVPNKDNNVTRLEVERLEVGGWERRSIRGGRREEKGMP
jgi:hypothetical protein